MQEIQKNGNKTMISFSQCISLSRQQGPQWLLAAYHTTTQGKITPAASAAI